MAARLFEFEYTILIRHELGCWFVNVLKHKIAASLVEFKNSILIKLDCKFILLLNNEILSIFVTRSSK